MHKITFLDLELLLHGTLDSLPLPDFRTRLIGIHLITPTEPFLLPSILDRYRQRKRMLDESGNLPYGVRFADMHTVFLTNGHHRWQVCKEQGRQRIQMNVYDFDHSLEQIIISSYRHRNTRYMDKQLERILETAAQEGAIYLPVQMELGLSLEPVH